MRLCHYLAYVYVTLLVEEPYFQEVWTTLLSMTLITPTLSLRTVCLFRFKLYATLKCCCTTKDLATAIINQTMK